MNYDEQKITKLLVKQKIIGYNHFPIEATLCDYAIDEPTTVLVLRIIVFSVCDSVENFIMNFVDQADIHDDPLFLVPLSSSKRLEVTSKVLKEL
jgi:hypothetical protein